MFQVAQAVLGRPVGDDVEARRLLQRAQGAFQKWPEGFAGFSAAIRCHDGDGVLEGEVSVFSGGGVDLRLPEDGALAAWARRALGGIARARTPRFFKDGDGRFPIIFEPGDGHPLGRGVRVHLGPTKWRTYRIDPKGRIRQEERVEATGRATATYDELVRACPGRALPTRIQVLRWDAVSRTVVERAEIEDGYERRDHVWLPVRRRATLVRGGHLRSFAFELSGHRLL